MAETDSARVCNMFVTCTKHSFMRKPWAMARPRSNPILEQDLRNWRFLRRFQMLLRKAERKVPASKRANHGLRKLHWDAYLSLFLLGLFNPIVTSMRGLCA